MISHVLPKISRRVGLAVFSAFLISGLAGGFANGGVVLPDFCKGNMGALSSGSVAAVDGKVDSSTLPLLDLSQAQRLSVILEHMTPENRASLYKTLDVDKMSLVARKIREGDQKSLPSDIQEILKNYPGTGFFLLDLLEFGDSFPGIFKLANADQTIMTVLEDIQKVEQSKTEIKNPNLLKSELMTSRLKRTIDDTLINIITQAVDEYGGAAFNRTWLQRRWHGIKMWFLPLHNRVAFLITGAQFFQKELERYRFIDQLTVKLGLAEAIPLKLTNTEINSLATMILESPKQVTEIEQTMQTIYNKNFKADALIQIGGFDIYGMYKRAKKFDFDKTIRSYDDSTLDSLKKLDDILDKAYERSGKGRRTLKNYDIQELKLYFEAYERGVDRYSSDYHAWTGQTSNEEYTVERQHTREVPDGTDEKGNTKYRTETYYTDDTVYPSFETILSGDYDTGDRFVTGLDGVKERAATMVKSERPYRALIDGLEEDFNKILEDYTNAVTNNIQKKRWHKAPLTKEQIRQEMTDGIQKINDVIQQATVYSNLTAAQVLAQYRRDDVKDFKGRNQNMVLRLKNMMNTYTVLTELLDRGELQIRPVFDTWDYTDWLYKLRSIRNKNYAVKTGMGAAVVAPIVEYQLSPDFQQMVDPWLNQASDLFNSMMQSISNLFQ